ncbi:MAG: hypothetical protein SWH54_15635 [Thermodesulfobacteriota bacterium]|nr:hypothetical protein [Thermodesulfobacteriota bacterium]
MTDRRVMVMDNNNDLIEIIRNTLMPYGYEAQLVEAGENGIHIVKSLKPTAVFVAARQSDKSSLALCSKAKKVTGSQIPVILISSNIPQSDLNLHGKQRYHADAYINETDFFNGAFVEKISTLIDLTPAEQVDAVPISDPPAMDAAAKNLSGNATIDGPLDALDDEPEWLAELYKENIGGETIDPDDDSSHTENDSDRYVAEESYTDDDLEQRLHQQEIEIAGLQAKIEETQREARSSPFSRDYLNLRENLARRERQIVQITEQLGKYRYKALTGDERLKELAKRMLNLKAELEQSQAREKELSLRYEAMPAELAKLKATLDESKKHYDSIIDKINKEHEDSVKKLAETHEEAVVSLKNKLKQEKINAKALAESDYQQKFDKLQLEHDAKIDSLREQVEKEKTKAVNESDIKWQQRIEKKQHEFDETIAQLKKEHQNELGSFKSGVDGVQGLLDTEIDALMDENKATVDRLKEEHQKTVDSLKKQIEKEKEEARAKFKAILESHEEFQKLEKGRHDLIPKLEKKHAEEITRLNAEHKKAIKKYQEELKTLDKKYKQDLHELDKKYSSEIGGIKQKKSAEIDDLKKKLARDAEKNAELLEEEKKAHKETRIRLESKIAEQLVTKAKQGSA